MKILIVEDEAPLADVLARNVRARGHEAAVAASGEAAILEMASSWPDVVVLDVNLPDFTGWEILRRLSAQDRARLHIVVISAAPLSQKRVEEFQPLRWLQKPFPMDALIRLIDDAKPSNSAVPQFEHKAVRQEDGRPRPPETPHSTPGGSAHG